MQQYGTTGRPSGVRRAGEARLGRGAGVKRAIARWAVRGLARLSRLGGSPHVVALGVAAGVFAAFVPLLGLQMALAAGIAYALRGSVMAALAGTFVGSPFTYPFMWLGSYRVGAVLLGHDEALRTRHAMDLWTGLSQGRFPSLGALWDLILPLVVPMVLGGLLLGVAAAVGTYYSVLRVAADLDRRRRQRREAPRLSEMPGRDAQLG